MTAAEHLHTPQTDERFLQEFETGRLPPERFHHREHVRLAWLYLRHDGLKRGLERTRAAVRRFATAAGKPERYHETLTCAWVALVWAALRADDGRAVQAGRWRLDFEAFAERHPELLRLDALARHYSPERLAEADARTAFVEPDRTPFPAA